MKTRLFPLFAFTPFALIAALGAVASASTMQAPQPDAPAALDAPAPELPPPPFAGPEDALSRMPADEEPSFVLPDDALPRVEAAALPSFEDDLPDGKSPPPTSGEWAHATEFEPLRAPFECRALRVREWVRIKCDLSRGDFVSSSLIAGSREGVTFGHNEFGQGYDVVFPVRKGDLRVFQILKIGAWTKYSVEYDMAFAISEAWPAGDRAPVITVD